MEGNDSSNIPSFWHVCKIETWLLFSVSSMCSRASDERKMMSQILSKNYDVEMAEKCRISLEEDWGADVPMLKCMVKKANTQKKFKLF
jgi:hypothetical protein